jgi:hypothetical protein
VTQFAAGVVMLNNREKLYGSALPSAALEKYLVQHQMELFSACSIFFEIVHVV